MRTSKKEVSIATYHAALSKIEKQKEISKKLRSDKRTLKKQLKATQISRANWKEKSQMHLHTSNLLIAKCLRLEKKCKPKYHHYETWLIALGVTLRVHCNSSYKSIAKIVTIIQIMLLGLKIEEVAAPCGQTIQNWVSKLGYYHLENLDNEHVGKEVCLFIDESIRVGTERLFMGLVCPYEKTKDSALSFEDVRVVYLQGSDSWTGDKIAAELSKTLKEKELEVKYVVSDEGNNLKKGIRLMNYNHLPDISHLIGTCLRHGFSKSTNYKAFISDIGRCQAKLAMGRYCYCRPPKQRAKARFMNQAKVVNWAEIVFEKWENFEDEVKVKLSMIPQHKQLIKQLAAALNLAKNITLALKKTGLNKKTIKKAIKQTAAELKKAVVDSCYHFFYNA